MDLTGGWWLLGRDMALVRWLERPGALLSRRKRALLLQLVALAVATLFFCEVLIYYLVIFRCRWPELGAAARGRREPVLKAMFLADTHLLGEVNGHWLDKLRREWQMERAFQTALWLLQPEAIFILGDVFDEGKWSHSKAWEEDMARFRKMFRHPRHVQLKVVAGNHDIGFHYQMSIYRVRRFEEAFSSDRLFSWKGVNFVMVNSVALEGDGCGICSQVEADLIEVSRKLNCSREERHSSQCAGGQRFPASAPILLQHYPLHRASDANCSGEDAAPPEERNIPFQEKYDVLSREASQKLLWWFRPRLILSGHTHSACEVLHRGRIPEISVPSFSWRNRNNPSFIMGSLTSSDFALSKCFLPLESTVLSTYCGAAGLLMVLAFTRLGRLALPFRSVWTLLRMLKAR